MRAQDRIAGSRSRSRLRRRLEPATEQPPPPARPTSQPSQQALLELQRTVGNAATASLIEAQQQPLPHVDGIIQRAVYTSKSDQYKTGNFNYDNEIRERVTEAKVQVGRSIPRSKTPDPKSFRSSNGLDGDIGWERGHVVALQNSGANEEFNIVPMKPGFNHGTKWRRIERDVRVAANTDDLRLTVTVNYDGQDPRIPSGIECLLEALRGNRWQLYKIPGLLSNGKVRLDHAAELTQEADADTAKNLTGSPTWAPGLLEHFKEIWIDRDQASGALARNEMPNANKAQWPDTGTSRPYQNLDLQLIAGNIPDVTVGQGRVFTAEQRTFILQANMALNNGTLRSDDPGDPHRILNEDGTADYPEIDHIIPKSAGGSNAYSNARLVSWELNNKLDRVKSINQLVDTKRLPRPSTQKLDEQIWHAVHRGETDSYGATDQDIRAYLGAEFNRSPAGRAFDRQFHNTINELVANSCLVRVMHESEVRYKIGPTDPMDR